MRNKFFLARVEFELKKQNLDFHSLHAHIEPGTEKNRAGT